MLRSIALCAHNVYSANRDDTPTLRQVHTCTRTARPADTGHWTNVGVMPSASRDEFIASFAMEIITMRWVNVGAMPILCLER